MAEATLLWLDCEFTSINDYHPENDSIWEIALVATDGRLKTLGSYAAFVAQDTEMIEGLAQRDWWVEHPEDYLRMCEAARTGLTAAIIDGQLVDFTKEHFGQKKVVIAGNSIGNDKRRIESIFPYFFSMLSHQVLDVTSFRIWGESRTGLGFHRPEHERHKAMRDIELSIQELVFWHNALTNARPITVDEF